MPIRRNEGESRDEFVSRCVSKEMDSGMPQDQALAVCLTYADEYFKSATPSVTDNTWSTAAPISVEFESYTDYPKAASENAKVALRWAEENGWGDCGTAVGKARANQLANGEAISRDTIARMAAFERHRQNSQKELGDGCGRLMWLAWGGDEGVEWAQRKLEQIDKQSLRFRKVSFDYDETLTTSRGKEMAKRAIERGDDVYIISARSSKIGILDTAEELGIPLNKVIAVGSNKAKVDKVKELGIWTHYDNNKDVVDFLPGVGQKFKKVSKVLFEEDYDLEEIKKYKDLGFKVYIRSKRKIKKSDKKVWNRLKTIGINEDSLLFGEPEQLHKKFSFDGVFKNDEDPILTMLTITGRPADYKNYVASQKVESIEEAIEFTKEFEKNAGLKFATLKTVFVYEEISGIPAAASGSRPFCSRMMANKREYSVSEIQEINNSHLVKMFSKYPGLEPSVLLYRGGFYRNPETGDITAWCRHQWSAKVVIAR